MVEMILAVFGGGDGEGDDGSEHGGRRVRCSRCLRVKAAYSIRRKGDSLRSPTVELLRLSQYQCSLISFRIN